MGQATTIHHWAFEDGTEGGPAAFEHVESTERPSDEEVQKAGLPFSAASLAHLTLLASLGGPLRHSQRACSNSVGFHANHAEIKLQKVLFG